MARVDDHELAVGEALFQKLGVGERGYSVATAGNDLDRGLDLREEAG